MSTKKLFPVVVGLLLVATLIAACAAPAAPTAAPARNRLTLRFLPNRLQNPTSRSFPRASSTSSGRQSRPAL